MTNTPRPMLDLDTYFPEVAQISDASLAEKVRAVWRDLWAQSFFDDLASVPTSGEIAYPNVPHTRSVTALALAIADVLARFHGTKIDRDVLIAACLLQDASKLVEYQPKPGGGVEKTAIGRAMPHAFEAARLAAQHGVPLPVLHIIATHSPSAAKLPETLEGRIVYLADEIDVTAIHGDQFVKEQIIRRR
ncbi:MAG: HD domain-containing protein [Roseomonas sp.]|nr:HD domain-containing protein [Roseomonas sp.]